MKKGIKFHDSSVLNFILFSKSLNFLKFLDKLEEAKRLFKTGTRKMHIWKLSFSTNIIS